MESGHIYKGYHEGWYSVSDEMFFPESQLTDDIDDEGNFIKVRHSCLAFYNLHFYCYLRILDFHFIYC
jgi:hypothetical protein